MYIFSKSNLTERYYSIKIFEHLNDCIFGINWQRYKEKPHQKQRLEDIIVIILQWCHPDKYINQSVFDKFIDNIVQEVLQSLKDEYPQHPILSISDKQFLIWRNKYIEKNFWCEKDAKSIKWVLDKIFVKFDFSESWMELNPIDIEPLYSPPVC